MTEPSAPVPPPPLTGTLPDRWWENSEILAIHFIADNIGLQGESDDTSRERVTDVLMTEECDRSREKGMIVVAPPIGSPHFADAVRFVVAGLNALPQATQIEVLDAERGRVRVGEKEATARVTVLVGDAMVLRRLPGRMTPASREAS